MEKFNRRDFIRLGAMGSLALASRGLAFAEPQTAAGGARTFKMKFAPGRGNEVFRTIAGKDPLKRLQFFKDQGFIAVEGIVWISHKPLSDKEKQMQQDIGDLAKKLGLEVGCMSSMNEKDFPTMSANQVPSKEKVIRDKSAIRDFLVWQMDNTFDILKRVGSKTFIIGPGTVDKELSWNKQYDNVVENMAFCADYCKKNGFVMEIEPLNTTRPSRAWRADLRGCKKPQLQNSLRFVPRTNASRKLGFLGQSHRVEKHRVFSYSRRSWAQRTRKRQHGLYENIQEDLG